MSVELINIDGHRGHLIETSQEDNGDWTYTAFGRNRREISQRGYYTNEKEALKGAKEAINAYLKGE
tara:strand:+ start:322 stop:519 length:198 start_codon:yes stop_codon:yes gene_type:complete